MRKHIGRKPIDIVTFDLDSTLCDTRHRREIIDTARERGDEPDWLAYSLACSDDKPVDSVVLLAQALSRTHDVWIVSSRHKEAEEPTRQWLHANGVRFVGMLLQGADGPQDLQQHKVAAILQIERKTGQKVAMHVDDSPYVAAALAEIGLSTLSVTPPGAQPWWSTPGSAA